MRTQILAGALLVTLVASPAAAGHGKKNLAQTIAAGEATSIAIDFPVGDLRIESDAGDTVRVDLKVECDRWFRSCEDRLEDVELRSDLEHGKLHIDIRGYGHGHSGDLEVNGTITVPANRALRVDMGVGQLDIDGIAGRLDVDLGVGDVTVRMPASAVRSVSIDAGVGDTTLRLPSGPVDDERSFVSSEIDWNEGRGEASVAVEVGVGDAVVRLE